MSLHVYAGQTLNSVCAFSMEENLENLVKYISSQASKPITLTHDTCNQIHAESTYHCTTWTTLRVF